VQPPNKINGFRTYDVAVPPSCAHQAAKMLWHKDSILAEVKEVIRD
jgi:hypothetical protein